jgi:nucleoside-diphosphate-sugar epimerase
LNDVKVFVAGAAGAIGRQLVPLLLAAGHAVTGTTRDPARVELLRAAGAEPIVLDIYDARAVERAIAAARPDVVINQLTDLASGFGPEQLRANSRLRRVGTRHLVDAMLSTGVTRLVAQSGAWLYGPGPLPHTEDQPLPEPKDQNDDPVLTGVRELERVTLETPRIVGVVLRYGFLYGPGTAYPERGDLKDGPSVSVFDAARAAALAIDRGSPGVYNIVDEDDAVSNRRAKELLGWAPSVR